MERRIRRLIGYILLTIVVLIEAAEWFTVLHEHIPNSVVDFVNQQTAIPLFIVGILFLFLSRGDSKEHTSTDAPSPLPPIPAPTTNQVNPIITVINHPPASSAIEPQRIVGPKAELSHNVQYVRMQTFGAEAGSAEVFAACFENVPIPNRAVKTFNNVKVKTDFKRAETGETYLTLFPGSWAQDEKDEIYMYVGKPHYAVIAMNVRGQWNAAETSVNRGPWGTTYDVENEVLPQGESIVTVTLIGDRGVSLEPEQFSLNIDSDGKATVRHVPRAISSDKG